MEAVALMLYRVDGVKAIVYTQSRGPRRVARVAGRLIEDSLNFNTVSDNDPLTTIING